MKFAYLLILRIHQIVRKMEEVVLKCAWRWQLRSHRVTFHIRIINTDKALTLYRFSQILSTT